MKLVDSKAMYIPQKPDIKGMYFQIETCGRVPYKSEDKSDGTLAGAKDFVERMIKSNHLSVLEHGTVYLTVPYMSENSYKLWDKYKNNPYSVAAQVQTISKKQELERSVIITSNFRVLVENKWLDDLEYFTNPTIYHRKRYTFKVVTSIGVTREFNRHRALSILEQSTRYCDFSKDKFDSEVTFCRPNWLNLNTGKYELVLNSNNIPNNDCIVGDGFIKPISEVDEEILFLEGCLRSEMEYKNLRDTIGWVPQQAREVLPLCTATEAVYTGFADDWKHFFNLRFFETTGKVHPNMFELSTKMKEEAVKAGIWNDIHDEPLT